MYRLFLGIIAGLFYVFFAAAPATAQACDGCIAWTPSHILTWDDFWGTPEPDSRMMSHYEVIVSYNYRKNDSGNYVFDVHCDFRSNKSWRRSDRARPYMLEHIQGNFDLDEIYARKLKQELEAYAGLPHFNKGKIKWIYIKNEEDRIAQNNLYDLETNMGYYFKDQEAWNQKINGLLGGLSQYASK